jgi:hypothetical protein
LAIEEEIAISIPISKYRAQMNIVILDLIEDNPINDSNTTIDSTDPIPDPTHLVTFNTHNSTDNTTTNPVDNTSNTSLLTKILNYYINSEAP